MKRYLLASVLLLVVVLAFGQEEKSKEKSKADNVIIKTTTKGGDNGEKIIEIIASGDDDIQGIIDSIMEIHGGDDEGNTKINVLRIPGFKYNYSFDMDDFEGMEDLEHIFELGDNMKMIGVDDFESLKKLQWMAEDKPFLGVIIDTDEEIGKGNRIMNIVEHSAAEEAGLKKEDILTGIGDVEINSLDDLVKVLSQFEIGDEINVHYERDDDAGIANATLKSRAESNYDLAKSFAFKTPACCSGEKPCEHHANREYKAMVHKQRPKLGVYVEDLDEEMIRDLRVSTGKGVLVTKVIDETAAKKMGLKINDVILKLNNQEVNDVNTLHEILGEQKLGEEIEVSYLRYGQLKAVKGILFEFNHHSAIDEMIFFRNEDE